MLFLIHFVCSIARTEMIYFLIKANLINRKVFCFCVVIFWCKLISISFAYSMNLFYIQNIGDLQSVDLSLSFILNLTSNKQSTVTAYFVISTFQSEFQPLIYTDQTFNQEVKIPNGINLFKPLSTLSLSWWCGQTVS